MAENVQSVGPATSTAQTGATEEKASKLRMASSESFNSVEDLREKEPKLYNMIMQGEVVSFINQDKRHWERIKELRRKAEQGRA